MRSIVVSLIISSIAIICKGQMNEPCNSICKHDDSLKQFFGAIGDVPIEVFLKKDNSQVQGYLDYFEVEYLDKFGKFVLPVNLKGSIDEKGAIRIFGFGIFDGKCSGDIFTGTFTDLHRDSLKYPFYLKPEDRLYDDWKTYTNENLGIQFDYPNDAIIKTASGEQYCPDGRRFLGDCDYLELFQKNKKCRKDFIEIQIPLDTEASLMERIFFISSWKEGSCCGSAIVYTQSGEMDTVYSKKLGTNQFYVQEFHEGAMSKGYETFSFCTCRKSDNRCFAFNYSTCYGSLGPYDVPYHEGYYNYDYVNRENYGGPKPLNRKAEMDMVEHIIKSLKFIKP